MAPPARDPPPAKRHGESWPPPLVILGLDSGDADLLLGWAERGVLPTLASLLARGAHGRLAGAEMVSAHGIWMTLFSGVSLRDHGHYLRRPLRPESYAIASPEWSYESAPPFWSRFRGHEVAVAVLDAPETRPLPGIRGVQLAGWATHPTRDDPSAEPTSLLRDVRRTCGEQIRTDESQRGRRHDERELRRILERVARKGALARGLVERAAFDLVVVVSGDSHAAAHRFARYAPKGGASIADVRDARNGQGELAGAVCAVYRAIDREMGLLLERMPGANVCIVANNGIRDGYPTWELADAFCHRLGYQVAATPDSMGSLALAFRERLLPSSVRRGLDHALPGAVRARLDESWFRRRTDWGRTTAFAVPSHYTSFLRVNLRGREPQGCVAPGEYRATLDRLEEDLLLLVDETTGEPAVSRVTRAVDAFGGGPPERLPDLIVEWRASDLAQHIRHPRAVLSRAASGDPRGNHHSRTGLLAAAGPSIEARGDVGALSPLDAAPLFLALMRQSLPAGARGDACAAFGVGADVGAGAAPDGGGAS